MSKWQQKDSFLSVTAVLLQNTPVSEEISKGVNNAHTLFLYSRILEIAPAQEIGKLLKKTLGSEEFSPAAK